jgi:hypothetical protein
MHRAPNVRNVTPMLCVSMVRVILDIFRVILDIFRSGSNPVHFTPVFTYIRSNSSFSFSNLYQKVPTLEFSFISSIRVSPNITKPLPPPVRIF